MVLELPVKKKSGANHLDVYRAGCLKCVCMHVYHFWNKEVIYEDEVLKLRNGRRWRGSQKSSFFLSSSPPCVLKQLGSQLALVPYSSCGLTGFRVNWIESVLCACPKLEAQPEDPSVCLSVAVAYPSRFLSQVITYFPDAQAKYYIVMYK